MKRVSIIVSIFILLALIYFTVYGESIYDHITPRVNAVLANNLATINDMHYLSIPKTALIEEGYVYIVKSEQGFSRPIHTIEKKEVTFVEFPELDINAVYIMSGISAGSRVVVQIDSGKPLNDGERVIVK